MWGCFSFACLKFDIDLLEQHNSEKGLLMVFAVYTSSVIYFSFFKIAFNVFQQLLFWSRKEKNKHTKMWKTMQWT